MAFRKLEISEEIRNTLQFRFLYYLIAGLSAPATAFFLNSTERGFYFTFVSLVGIYSILDLGLGQTLLIIFSKDQSFNLNNIEVKKKLLIVRNYYKLLAFAFIFFSIIIGWIFFKRFEQNTINWQGPWVLTCFSTGILLLNSAKLIFIEASGKLANVANMRSQQTIIANIILIILLFLKFSLWSFAFYQFSLAIFSSHFIYFAKESSVYREGRWIKEKFDVGNAIKLWKKEIFPLQWRISINYMCGIIIFQLITPFVFNSLGPENAGTVGLTLNISNAIIVICSSFLSASIPMLSKLVEAESHQKVFKKFLKLTKRSFFLSCILFLAGFLITFKFHENFPHIFLNPQITFLIILNSICHVLIYNFVTYFRTYKKEPLIVQSIISAILHLSIYLRINTLSLEEAFLFIFIINFLILVNTIILLRSFKESKLKLQ